MQLNSSVVEIGDMRTREVSDWPDDLNPLPSSTELVLREEVNLSEGKYDTVIWLVKKIAPGVSREAINRDPYGALEKIGVPSDYAFQTVNFGGRAEITNLHDLLRSCGYAIK